MRYFFYVSDNSKVISFPTETVFLSQDEWGALNTSQTRQVSRYTFLFIEIKDHHGNACEKLSIYLFKTLQLLHTDSNEFCDKKPELFFPLN